MVRVLLQLFIRGYAKRVENGSRKGGIGGAVILGLMLALAAVGLYLSFRESDFLYLIPFGLALGALIGGLFGSFLPIGE